MMSVLSALGLKYELGSAQLVNSTISDPIKKADPMKQFYSLLALAFFFPHFTIAQYIADNDAAIHPLLRHEVPVPRSWEKEQDLVNGHISNSQLSKMKAVTTNLITFFHDSCLTDEQLTPLWHGEYYSEKNSSVTQKKFGAICNFYEQKARLSIVANDISPLLDHLVVNNQDFLTIQPVTSVKNNSPYWEYTSDGAPSLFTKVWLVTTGDGQLPYTPVSRKEYLQEARAELTAIRNNVIATWKQKIPVRPAAIQEAEKKAALEELSRLYSGMDLQVRTNMMLRNYKTDEQYLKENTDKATAGLDNTIEVMGNILAHLSATELNKPAIVSLPAADFQGFEEDASGKMLIRMNPTYFDPYLPGEKPQFFLLTWQYEHSEPMAIALDRQLQERLDCGKLQEMLPSHATHPDSERSK
jgi:hypothetical protein